MIVDGVLGASAKRPKGSVKITIAWPPMGGYAIGPNEGLADQFNGGGPVECSFETDCFIAFAHAPGKVKYGDDVYETPVIEQVNEISISGLFEPAQLMNFLTKLLIHMSASGFSAEELFALCSKVTAMIEEYDLQEERDRMNTVAGVARMLLESPLNDNTNQKEDES